MDLDVWKYPDVRHWFNKDGGEIQPYNVTPAQSGYMIKID